MKTQTADAFEEALEQEAAEARRMPGNDEFEEYAGYDEIWSVTGARVLRDPDTYACRFQYHATPGMSFDFSLWSEVGELCRPLFASFIARHRLFYVELWDGDVATGAKRKYRQ